MRRTGQVEVAGARGWERRATRRRRHLSERDLTTQWGFQQGFDRLLTTQWRLQQGFVLAPHNSMATSAKVLHQVQYGFQQGCPNGGWGTHGGARGCRRLKPNTGFNRISIGSLKCTRGFNRLLKTQWRVGHARRRTRVPPLKTQYGFQ